MKEHTYQVLEFHRLLDILSRSANCTMGKSNCLSLKPSNDLAFIDNELRLVSEMRILLKAQGFVSLSDLTDILPLLRKSSTEGSFLEPNELLLILSLVHACMHSKKHLKSHQSLCPRVYALANDIPCCETLVKILKDTISSNGALKDSASPALKKIRGKKFRLRLDLQKRLENIQKHAGLFDEGQNHLVTIRDGRYVITLRTDQKSRIEGIIHGYSQTRVTCFLEPVEVITYNNRMAELIQEEKTEERRILINLTGMVRDLAAELENSQGLIGRLDGLYARARFSDMLSCVMPEISEKLGVELKGARNPILLAMALERRDRGEKYEGPVPVDILLDDQHNILVISGPNKGGKTVTLKTLGLMGLMAQAGIHIPAEEGSILPVFNEIMADIGDDQDIRTGLSTFSAHAANLSYILEHTDHKSLVIIDDPGMGTDPDEGVALAMSVLDFLSEQGTYVAVSTHLNRLKSYGLLNQRVTNACVEFDVDKMCPTFKLKYGSPGISHGLEIAKEMGISLNILDRARGYLDQDEVRLNNLIEKLNYLMTETTQEKTEVEDIKRKYYAATRKIKDEQDKLEAERQSLLEAKRIEAENVIREAGEELKQAINLLKTKKKLTQAYVAEKYAEVTGKLMGHFAPEANAGASVDLKEVEEGQLVYHRRLKKKGIVQSVDTMAGRAFVFIGNVKVSSEAHDLEMFKDDQETNLDEKQRSAFWNLKNSPIRELNVVGYRVNDAIPLIDKAIDRALVDGQLSLRIIHGFGTGRLRQAIRLHLKDLPFVKSFCSAEPRVGGGAITIVELS
jgi:DNA mismatch repair protein MutS2